MMNKKKNLRVCVALNYGGSEGNDNRGQKYEEGNQYKEQIALKQQT